MGLYGVMRLLRWVIVASLVAVLPVGGLSFAWSCGGAAGATRCCCPADACRCPGHAPEPTDPGPELGTCSCGPALPESSVPEPADSRAGTASCVAAMDPRGPIAIHPDPGRGDRSTSHAAPPGSGVAAFLLDCALLI